MESQILKFVCANQGAVDTEFLVCNLGCSVSEVLSSSDKFVPCCPFGQPKVVARTRARLCRTQDCPGSCRGLHLCKNFLFSGSCQFTLTRRGCLFSHALDSAHNGQILKEHGLEHLSRAELCTLLLQSDDRLLPRLCHDYNTGVGLFGGCKEGLACKRLHVCERYLNLNCTCSRNHNFGVPHTLSLLQGVPRDLSLKSIYANIQALKYHDLQSNKAKGGNQKLGGKGGNRRVGGRRRGRVKKPSVSTDAKADVDKSGDSDVQAEGNTDDELQDQPAEGAVAPKIGANGYEEWLLVDMPRLLSLAKLQQPSEGGVATLSVTENHQQLHQTTSALNNGACQQVRHASGVSCSWFSPTSPLIQGASATGVASAGPQPIYPHKSSAATEEKPGIVSTHQPLQGSSTTGVAPAAASAGPHPIHLQKNSAATEEKRGIVSTHQPPQGASATGVALAAAPAAASAGPQPIYPQKTLAATEEKRGIVSTHQQGASATSIVTAAVSNSADKNNSSNSPKTQQLLIDKTEICKDFLRGQCKLQERCLKAHDRMPYRWEINKNGQWIPLPCNEAIEKDFCDPEKTYNSFPCIHFNTMTKESNKIRRIDAGNSLLEPDFSLATEWLWYWKDEFDKWNTYASPDGGHKQADVDSRFLEQLFLADPNHAVRFKANSQTYSLSFKDMIQKNIYFGTKKLVRRRPRFVSAADVQEGRLSKPGGHESFSAVPSHWDKTQLPQTGYKRVPLMALSEEYKEVEALFRKTMRGFHIVKIERIQNKTLWDFFHLQKTQMKNSNRGRPVLEMKLFHGTDNQYVDTICHTNFDWRLCGSHGTAFGKGSYFALNAKYSHSYTSDSKVRSMFAVRLLVGEYTKGSPEYRRPPSKDGGDINFYDSCVDDVDAPSIYVVFDKHQIYPEYLLQYQEYGAGISSIASVQASGISQSLYSNQASRPQPTLSFSSTAASSSHSTQKNSSEEKSCTVS